MLDIANIRIFPDSSVGKGSACNAGDSGSIPGSGRSAREGIGYPTQYSWASFVAQLVRNLPSMWETWVQPLGSADSPWRRERLPTPVFWPGEFHGLYIVHGLTKSQTQLSDFHFHCQYSFLEIVPIFILINDGWFNCFSKVIAAELSNNFCNIDKFKSHFSHHAVRLNVYLKPLLSLWTVCLYPLLIVLLHCWSF